jgi:hypothetical protein
VGCRQVGQDQDFAIGVDAAARLAEVRAPAAPRAARPYDLLPIGADRIADLRALYQMEPARFLRPLEDWQMAFACGVIMNRASDFWGVFAAGTLVAYLIVHRPGDAPRRPGEPIVTRIVEFAGQREAVAASIPSLLRHYATEGVHIHVQATDPVLRAVLSSGTGLNGSPAGASGTLRVINFPQLMERCRPLLAERIGTEAAGELSFGADERPGSALGGFMIRGGGERLRIPDLSTLAQYLFGAPTPMAAQPDGSSRIAEVMGRALPLPSLWYGLSYV